jgi:hypothetical protein
MKSLSVLGAIVLALLVGFAREATAQGRFIVNQLSGRCLDVVGAPGTQNGARIVLYDCEFSGQSANLAQTDQQWQVLPSGLIRNILSGRCIDVSGGPGRNNGTPIVLFDCEVGQRNSDQYWRRQ